MKYKLKDICLTVTDGSHFSPKAQDEGFPMFSVKDMLEYGFDYSNCKRISEEDFEKMRSSGCVPQEGDVLVAKDGSYLKEIFVYTETKDEAILSSIAIFRPNQEMVNPYYLCYLLKSPQIFNYISSNCVSGSALPRIVLKAFKEVEMDVPSMDIQLKVVNMLKFIDAKVQTNTAINRNLLDQGRALYEDLISKYEINAKLSDLISSIETGSRPKGGAQESGVPSIGAEKIESFGVYDYSGEKYISEEFFEKLKRGHILSGDVLLYKDGAYTGKTSMALNDFPHAKCAINEHVYKLNSNNNLYQFFLYFTLDNKKNRDYIYTLASSKAAQPGLNQTELLSVDIAMPVETSLIEFEKNVSEMMNMIASNAKENRKLTLLRDSLLPKLMSGEIDVSELDV